MLGNLLQEIQRWMNASEQIILLIDCNEDVRNNILKQKMLNVGLTEILTQGREENPKPTHA